MEYQSSSEEEQDPKGKEKVSSTFKINIKGGQTKIGEEKKRKPIAKKRMITSKEKKSAQEEECEEEGKKGDTLVLKRRRVMRTSTKKNEPPRGEDEIGPQLVNVESSREKT